MRSNMCDIRYLWATEGRVSFKQSPKYTWVLVNVSVTRRQARELITKIKSTSQYSDLRISKFIRNEVW